jgi:betaine-aldehyde dehydrogenase
MTISSDARASALARVPDLPTGLLIGGDDRPASDGASLPNLDPATEELIASVAAAGVADVDAAVAAARAAFGPWSRTNGRDRARLMHTLADLVRRDAELLVAVETLENGSPPGSPQIPMTADLFDYFAGWADKIHGSVIPTPGAMDPTAAPGAPLRPSHVYTKREPVGVVAAIIPWNAPLLTAAMKLAPLLAAGCTAVLKTAEDSMQSVLYLGRLVTEAGFPPGVVNIINGGAQAGAALAEHPKVDHVSFTGSPTIGRAVAEAAARSTKRVTLELGGKNPQIVFADADLEKASITSAIGIVANQGQVCLSGSRILVHESVYDDVVARIAGVAASIKVGDPFDPGTMMGALISARHRDRVLGYVEAGRSEGARVVAGGEPVAGSGYFVQPTFFADAAPGMSIVQEEIFGPVGVIMPFADEEEAITLAHDTPYGLAATVWTNDLSRAHRLAGELQVGAVSINVWSPLDPAVPHGGLRRSGIGRENGWAAIEDFTEEKTVTVAL